MAEARTGFEPTEIFTATAMFFNSGQLTAAANDIAKLVEFFDLAKAKLGNIEFGSNNDRDVFSSYYELNP